MRALADDARPGPRRPGGRRVADRCSTRPTRSPTDISLTLLEKDAEVYERTGPEFQVDVRASTREHIRRGIEAMAGRRGRQPRHRRSCGARPAAAGPARASRWSWCSTPTRSAPGCCGRRWSPRASGGRRRRPGAAGRRPAGVVGARRAERRVHRRLPARERPPAPPRPAAPAEHPRRAGRGPRRRPDVRRRGPRGARHRRRDGRRLRRGAVRRVAGRAAHAARASGWSGSASPRTGTCAAGCTSGCSPASCRDDDELVDAARAARHRPGRAGPVARRRGRVRDRVPAGRAGRRHGAARGAVRGRGLAAAARGAARRQPGGGGAAGAGDGRADARPAAARWPRR